MKKTRILIADDHSVVRSGLRALLQSSPEYTIVGEAENGEEAVEMAVRLKPDVIVMDISMPKMNGIEATAKLKHLDHSVRIIILTVHEDEEYVFQILKAGASGYVLKTAGKKEIFAAIDSALVGDRFFSPGISRVIIDGFIRRDGGQTVVAESAVHDDVQTLTRREREVLQYIARGFTNRRIAETLFLSVRTINTHRTNLMQKLDIHDTAGLVRYAIESGILKLKVQTAESEENPS
jgi:two-component system response regulator NreC